jgi:hypothetical protein
LGENLKIKALALLLMATFMAVLTPQTAFADTITLTLDTPVRNVTVDGGDLIFSGTIAALGSNSNTQFFNGDFFTFTMDPSLFSIDDSAYFNNVFSLAPGASYTGELFTLTLLNGLTPGNYSGTFDLLGGTDIFAFDTLASTTFQANVLSPDAVTPEPSSFLLLATGMLAAAVVVMRRQQAF